MLQASHRKTCKKHENLKMLESAVFKGTWLGSFAICTATGLQGFQQNFKSLIFHDISHNFKCSCVCPASTPAKPRLVAFRGRRPSRNLQLSRNSSSRNLTLGSERNQLSLPCLGVTCYIAKTSWIVQKGWVSFIAKLRYSLLRHQRHSNCCTHTMTRIPG